MEKNVMLFVSGFVFIIIIAIAFFLLFKRSEIDPDLTDDSKTQQLEPTTNFNYQGTVTAPNQDGGPSGIPAIIPSGMIKLYEAMGGKLVAS